jgi:hypothetical protein
VDGRVASVRPSEESARRVARGVRLVVMSRARLLKVVALNRPGARAAVVMTKPALPTRVGVRVRVAAGTRPLRAPTRARARARAAALVMTRAVPTRLRVLRGDPTRSRTTLATASRAQPPQMPTVMAREVASEASVVNAAAAEDVAADAVEAPGEEKAIGKAPSRMEVPRAVVLISPRGRRVLAPARKSHLALTLHPAHKATVPIVMTSATTM